MKRWIAISHLMANLLIAIFILTQFALPCHAGSMNIFLVAGIPATDREWFGFDYKLTADIFVSGKVSLPHFLDKDGACLLDRITSTNNFSFYLNKTIPLKSRMEDFSTLTESADTIFKLYFKDANKGENVHKELAHMLAFMLLTANVQMNLADEFIPTIPKDEKYDTRMDGLRKMNSGLMIIFVGAENTLSERKNYSTDDLSTMLEAMANTLPHLKTAFSSDYRIELQKKLEAHKAEFKGQGDLNRIDQMITELNK